MIGTLILTLAAAPAVLDCGAFVLRADGEGEPAYSVDGHSMNWPYSTADFSAASGSLTDGLSLSWRMPESTAGREGPRDLVVTLELAPFDDANGSADFTLVGVSPPRDPRVSATVRRYRDFESSGECVPLADEDASQ